MMDAALLFGSTTGPIGMALNVANFGVAAGFAAWAFSKKIPSKPIRDGFQLWSEVNYYLSTLQTEAHAVLSESSKKVIRSPISSKEGIYGALAGGAFMAPLRPGNIPKAEDHLRSMALAMSLNVILRAINVFITIGSYQCTESGPNGAFPQKDRLSFCYQPRGPMYNIMRADGNKAVLDIKNANVISEIFGFPTKLIVESSINCQKKYGFDHAHVGKETIASDLTDDCLFNIPACDCTSGDVNNHIPHDGFAKACRDYGHLPI